MLTDPSGHQWLGAKIMRDVTEIPEAGWMSIIVDPTGAMLALWKPKPRVHGCHGPPEGGH